MLPPKIKKTLMSLDSYFDQVKPKPVENEEPVESGNDSPETTPPPQQPAERKLSKGSHSILFAFKILPHFISFSFPYFSSYPLTCVCIPSWLNHLPFDELSVSYLLPFEKRMFYDSQLQFSKMLWQKGLQG